jgi:hypothetical protein
VLDQPPTSGAFTRLPAGLLTQVLVGVWDAIDALGGRFTAGCSIVVVTAVRT